MTTFADLQAISRAHELNRAMLAGQVTDYDLCQVLFRESLTQHARGRRQHARNVAMLGGLVWAKVCAEQQAATS